MGSLWSHCLSLAALAQTSGWISNPAGRWEKSLSQSHQEAITIDCISQLKYGETELGLAQSGGLDALAHVRLSVSRGRESIELRGLAQILADFSFSRVKEEPNQRQMSQPGAKWALCNLFLIVWGFWGFLFPWKASCSEMKSKGYGGCNNALQITSAMQMRAFNKSLEFPQSQISMTDESQFIHALHVHCVAAPGKEAEASLFQQQSPSASIHLEVNKLSSFFTLPFSLFEALRMLRGREA